MSNARVGTVGEGMDHTISRSQIGTQHTQNTDTR